VKRVLRNAIYIVLGFVDYSVYPNRMTQRTGRTRDDDYERGLFIFDEKIESIKRWDYVAV